MMQLFLQPMDVWLFRDGKPFNADGDHRAESLFPPFPTVVQGALRSFHLSLGQEQNLNDPAVIRARIGTVDTYPQDFCIKGPFVARQEGHNLVRYFPQPADAVTVDPAQHLLRPAQPPVKLTDGTKTNSATTHLLGLDEPLEKGESGLWLSYEALMKYLEGKTVTGLPAEQLFTRQSYPGIGMQNARRVTKEGALFEVEYIRPQDGTGLYVEVGGLAGWPENGILQLGGENRGASFEQIAPLPWSALPNQLPARFKVYFASPAYFEAGWQPASWSTYFEGKVELVAAAINRYQAVGGYDYAGKSHKASRRCVPAGSVYYFTAGANAHLKPGNHGAISEPADAQIGFGQFIIRGW